MHIANQELHCTSFFRLIGWLTDWLYDWLIDWLIFLTVTQWLYSLSWLVANQETTTTLWSGLPEPRLVQICWNSLWSASTCSSLSRLSVMHGFHLDVKGEQAQTQAGLKRRKCAHNYFHLKASFSCSSSIYSNDFTSNSISSVRSHIISLRTNEEQKSWLLMYLTLWPHIPALFVTSLIQTYLHKMAALSIVFSVFFTRWFLSSRIRNQDE